MGVTTGKGRILNGSGADRIKRWNLTEFRGTLWDAATDWFLGYNSVDFDWKDVSDSTKFRTWVYTEANSIVTQIDIDTSNHEVTANAISGDIDGLSNKRELYVIDETATWGVAHAQCEIVGNMFYTGNSLDDDRLVIKPQHGIGLRAQEDTQRRTAIAWHDIAIGLPQSINLGVWSGNLDGSGFANRQAGIAMDLDDNYVQSANSQVCDDDAGLVFDGTAGNWESPDHADYEVTTGDWSVKVDVTMSDWTPAAQQSFFSKYNTVGAQRAYRLYITTTGQITVVGSTDGNGGASLSTFTLDAAGTAIVAALGNGARRTIAVDYDADNGASGRTVTFYLGESWTGPFTQLGAPITIATASVTIFSGTALLELGAVNDGLGERLNGRIHQFVLRRVRLDLDSPNSTPSADVHVQKVTNAVTTFVDSVGKTWNRGGSSSIVLANTTPPRGTVTIGTHQIIVGDRINIVNGGEYSITALQRTGGSACQCTLPGGHTVVTGSFVRLLFSSDSSFDGSFPVFVSGNTMTWTDAGSNVSGHTGLAWDNTYDRNTAIVTAVTATDVEYETFGLTNAAIELDANCRVYREFPYFMEMKLEGTVASVRCWGRHQTVPDWMDLTRALIADLSKASQVYTVTAATRTSNVIEATIGAHNLIIGERISMTAMSDSTFNQTNAIVTGITATTYTYADTGSDAGPGVTGTATRLGTGTAATVISSPCPEGSGRVAFVGAHIGVNDKASCRYGPFFGDNDPFSLVINTSYNAAMGEAIEVEEAQTVSVPSGDQNITPTVITATVTMQQSTMLPGVVTLTPTVITVSTTLNQPTVAPGVVTLTPTVITATVTMQTPTITTGAVTLTPAAISAAVTMQQPVEILFLTPAVITVSTTLDQPTVLPGTRTLTPAVITATATMQQPTLLPGSVSLTPSVINAVATTHQPTITTSVTVTPAVITATPTLNQPTITASKTLTPAVITATATLSQPTITTGPVTLTPAVITATVTVQQPTVVGAGAAAPTFINAAATFSQPTITTGSVSLTPSVITAPATFTQPLVARDQALTPAVINAAPATQQPTVLPGARTLTPTVISASATVQQFTAITLFVVPSFINAAPAVQQPSVLLTQTLTPSFINAAPTVQAPTVARGSVTATPSVITATATVQQQTIVSIVASTVITASVTMQQPTLARGSVSLTPSVITNTATVNQPFVAVGQQIAPSVINASVTVQAPAVITILIPTVINAAVTVSDPIVLRGQVVIATTVIDATPQLFAPLLLNFAADANPVSVEFVSPDYTVEYTTPAYSASGAQGAGVASFSEPDNTIEFSAEYNVVGSTPSYNVSYTER